MADYVTLAQVKAELGDLGTDYDSLLGAKITRSSLKIDRITKRPYGFSLTAGVTSFFNGNASRTLFVPDLNALTTLSVKVGGTWATTYTAVPSTDYFLEPIDRRPGFPALWIDLTDYPRSQVTQFWEGKATVQVLGDWGWAATPVEIADVCLEMVIRSWRSRGAGQEDKSGADNLDQVMIPRGLSRESRDILSEFTYHRASFT